MGNDAHAVDTPLEIVGEGGEEQLARMLPLLPDKQPTNLIATLRFCRTNSRPI